MTPEKWEKLAEHKTATSGFTLAKVSRKSVGNFTHELVDLIAMFLFLKD